MSTKLSQIHMDQIAAMRIQAANGQIGYWQIYQTLAILLQTDYGYEATNPTVLWLRGATEANAGRGSMSDLIRVYSSTQAMLRYGEMVSESEMQEASNEVAKTLLQNLFGEERIETYAFIPEIGDIADQDATAVGRILFNRDPNDTAAPQADGKGNAAWSGTLLFTQLTSDQSYRLMSKGVDALAVDSLNDWRDVLYAYVSYEAGLKAAATEFLKNVVIDETIGGNQTAKDISILGQTFYGYVMGGKTFIDYLSTLATGTDNQNLLSSFGLINSVGVNRFLDMLMGAVLGKPIIGTTNDDNFFANARAFFQSSILDLETQSLNQLNLSELITLGKTDANVRSALNVLSLVSIETSAAVQNKFVLYNSATEQGEITEQWIEDRAKALLTFKNYWLTGTTIGSPLPDQNWVIEDLSTGIKIVKVGSNLSAAQNSFIFGTEGNDIDIHGVAGKDHIYGGRGNDQLFGGTGDDYLEGGNGSDNLYGGDDHDKLVGMDGIDYLYGGNGNDVLLGGAENDELHGGDGNDYLHGGSGDDQLNGDNGNDILIGGKGGLNADGGDGNDIIYANLVETTALVLPDELRGGMGNDIIYAGIAPSVINGGYGNDLIYGGSGNDIIEGGAGVNILQGGAGINTYQFYTSPILGAFDTTLIKDTNGIITINGTQLEVGEYNQDINAWYSTDNQYIIKKIEGDAGQTLISIYQKDDNKTIIYVDGWNTNGDMGLSFSEIPPQTIPSTGNLPLLNDGNNIAYQQNQVNAGGGNDYVEGTQGNDIIHGGNGNNFINGLEGDDVLQGGDDQDIIFAAVGKDKIYGGGGGDLILSSADSTISPSYFASALHSQFIGLSTTALLSKIATDTSESFDINFTYEAEFSNESQSYTYYLIKNGIVTPILLPAIQILLQSNTERSLLDSVFSLLETDDGGASGSDQVHGGTGDDFILGSGDADQLYGELDADYLYGRGGDDDLYGGQGQDHIYGGSGRDHINGGTENDLLVGGYEADVIYGGDGVDAIFGDLPNLFGTDAPPASADQSRYADDLIYGGKGGDTLRGNGGNDIIHGDNDGDFVFGEEGNDILYGGQGIDYINGGDGKDILFGGTEADKLYGMAESDILFGGSGIDHLYGGEGDDLLYGDAENDFLYGGTGSDQYIFSIGDGKDTVIEEVSDIASLNYQNFIYFTFDPNQISSVARDEFNLIIQYGATDQITVKDYYKIRNTANHSYLENQDLFEQIEISELRFEDGTVWDTAKIMEMAPPPAVNELPIEVRGDIAYFVDALATRDQIAVQGKTIISYSFPLNSASGNQPFYLEQMNAIEQALSKFAEVLNVSFVRSETGAGDLKFYLDDLTEVDAGAAAGYASASNGQIHLNSAYFNTSYSLNEGQNGFEVLLHEIGHALGLEHPFEAPVLPEFENNQNNTIMSYTHNGVNDTELKIYDIAALHYLHGVNQNIRAENNTYTFADKYIWDGNGIDTFDASEQTQSVYIDLNAGGWSYIGQKNQSILAQGQSFIGYGTNIENSKGGSGDDTLVGNQKNNILEGGLGKDIYVINANFGKDEIIEVDGMNTLMLQGGNYNQNNISYVNNTILDRLSGSEVKFDIQNFNNINISGIQYTQEQFEQKFGGYISTISDISLSDQQRNVIVFGETDVSVQANSQDNKLLGNDGNNNLFGFDGDDYLDGGRGNDQLFGGNGTDILTGGEGNDKLYGGDENNILEGGLGNDLLYGGEQDDTYIFSSQDGVDTVSDQNGQNIIYLKDILPTQIEFQVTSLGNLTILYGEGAQVTINSYFSNVNQFNIKFGNNDVWTYPDILERLQNTFIGTEFEDNLSGNLYLNNTVTGLLGNDTLVGGNLDDLIFGDTEVDYNQSQNGNYQILNDNGTFSLIYHEYGNDVVNGGKGNDLLVGGRGNDTYLYKKGDGLDIIYDVFKYLDNSEEADAKYMELNWGLELDDDVFINFAKENGKFNKIKFEDVSSTEIEIRVNNNDLEIVYGESDKIIVKDFMSAVYSRYGHGEIYSIAEIEFSDGSVFSYKDIINHISHYEIQGTDSSDIITGKGASHTIYGLNGDDTISGGSQDDNIFGGDGNDVIDGLSGINNLYGGDGNDVLEGRGGINNFYGDDGDDQLIVSQADIAKLFGGGGNDYLQVQDSDAAILNGGAGYDTYEVIGAKDTLILDEDYQGLIKIDAKLVYYNWAANIHNPGYNGWQYYYDFNYLPHNGDLVSTYVDGYNNLNHVYKYTDTTTRNVKITVDFQSGMLNVVKEGTSYNTSFTEFNNGFNYLKFQNIYSYSDILNLGQMKVEISDGLQIGFPGNLGNYIGQYVQTTLSFQDFINQGEVEVTYTVEDDVIFGITNSAQIDSLGDIIYAGAGNDQIITGLGNSLVYAEDGDDLIIATDTKALDEIYGGVGADTIYNYDPSDQNLTINYHSYPIDKIYGGEGNDNIYVRYQFADAYGGEGNDTLIGDGNLYGGLGNDQLIASDLGAYLDGGDGIDHLIGGLGDDTFVVDEFDTYEENDPNGGYDTLNIAQSVDLSLGYFEAVTLAGNQNFNILGNAADNRLIGNDGNNHIDGRAGSDYMAGGLGNDYYVVDVTDNIATNENGNTYVVNGDRVFEEEDGGIDTLERWQDSRYIGEDANGNPVLTNSHRLLEENIENLILKGNAKTAFGNDLDNIIVGNNQDNYIDGLSGNDTYVFAKGGGTDTYSFNDEIAATNILKIQGYSASDLIAQKYGNSVYLSFKGTSDHIWLSNYYVADTANTTYRMDQIIFDSGTTWTSTDIDELVNRAQNNHAPTVNASIPMITSNQGTVFSYKFASNVIVDQDTWDSLSYKITLTTTDSSGQYQPIPSWLSFDAATQTLSGTPPSNVTGNLSFFYWGTDMYGRGAGTSFTLKVNPPNQTPIVLNAIADQTVIDAKAFSYTVPSTAFKDPDNDVLTYSATLEDGSPLPSWLTFNTNTRVLSGTSPDNAAPLNIKITVKDTANQTVSDVFKITFVVQNQTINGTSSVDTLYGASGNDVITGQAGNDTLYGQSGNDTLNGGTGNDTMYGGKGDDTYVVDSTTDVVNESANEGTDTVQSTVTYTLSNNLENLTLTGSNAINGTGNALNNTLVGNSAVNTLTGGAGDDYLDGGTGNDKLLGGLGNDTYVVDSTSDLITENTNEGIDTVRSSVTLTLANNLENLNLLGTSAINGTGNALNNILIGNTAVNILTGGAGNDYLDGATGADKLFGGVGNDIYVIDNTGDTITENTNEGTDTVLGTITYTLGNNLENLALSGSAAINATGNTLNNTLIGNSAANTLNGGAGNDILIGGTGSDILFGSTGADIFVWGKTLNTTTGNLESNGLNNADGSTDTIKDFNLSQSDKVDAKALLDALGWNGNLGTLSQFVSVSGNTIDIHDVADTQSVNIVVEGQTFSSLNDMITKTNFQTM